MAKLIEACKSGDLAHVKKLIKEGYSVNKAPVKSLRTPLLEASYRGHSDIVGYLLEQNADVNKTDDFGVSILHYTCQNGHLDIVNMLLSKGADIGAVDINGYTPLMEAILGGHHTVVEALISSGASVNVKSRSGDKVFDYSLENGHLNIINMLISKGAVTKSKDGQDMTPLIGAIV